MQEIFCKFGKTDCTILIISLSVLFSFYGIAKILKWLRGKVKKLVEQIKSPAFNEDKEKSLKQANLIAMREKELHWLTKAVALIELVAFGTLTLLVFKEEPTISLLSKTKILGAFLGGWLGIKVLSSHRPWSDEIVGKAYYHISLIGTLLNVTTGFIAGWLLYVAWFIIP